MNKIRYENMENLLVNLLVPPHRFNHTSIPSPHHYTSTPTSQSHATQHNTSTPSSPTITPLSPILHQNQVIVNNVSVDIMATAGMEGEAMALDKTVVTEVVVAEDGRAEIVAMVVAEDGDGLSMTRVKIFIQVLSYMFKNKSC